VEAFFAGLERLIGKGPAITASLDPTTTFKMAAMWCLEAKPWSLRDAALLAVETVTLQRISQLLHATVGSIADKGKPRGLEWWVPRSKTDQLERGLLVPIPETTNHGKFPVADTLRAHMASLGPVESSHPLFPAWDNKKNCWKSTPLAPSGWNAALRRGLQQLGIPQQPTVSGSGATRPPPRIGSHAVRRGATTALVDNGASYEQLRPILGHSSANAVFKYHLQSVASRKAVITDFL
jgi:integrase